MKKIKPVEIKSGIWLDNQNAFIVLIREYKDPEIIKLKSEVETKNSFQHAGFVTEHERHGVVKDQEKLQRRQHQEKLQFFKEIIEQLKAVNYIYIFGPGQAKEGLQNAIEENTSLKGKVVAMGSADKMSQKVMIQQTVSYFNGENFKLYKRNLRRLKAIM